MTPVMPDIKVSGKKTANMVNVDATTDRATSLVACIAARLGSAPRSMWVVTFSNTTIESSTTIPIDMIRALSEIILIEPPVANRYMNDATSERGIVMATTRVARQRPVKR